MSSIDAQLCIVSVAAQFASHHFASFRFVGTTIWIFKLSILFHSPDCEWLHCNSNNALCEIHIINRRCTLWDGKFYENISNTVPNINWFCGATKNFFFFVIFQIKLKMRFLLSLWSGELFLCVFFNLMGTFTVRCRVPLFLVTCIFNVLPHSFRAGLLESIMSFLQLQPFILRTFSNACNFPALFSIARFVMFSI